MLAKAPMMPTPMNITKIAVMRPPMVKATVPVPTVVSVTMAHHRRPPRCGCWRRRAALEGQHHDARYHERCGGHT